MTEETAISISDGVRDAFMAFDDDYLADVFGLWDCDLKDWHDPCVTIFRFEREDIMVWYEGGTLMYCLGAFDNDVTSAFFPPKVKASINADACLCWLRNRHCDELIGSTNISRNLLELLA